MDDGATTDGGEADAAALARDLLSEARRADERRLLVLAGDREATYRAARAVLSGTDFDPGQVTLVGERDALDCERVRPTEAGHLLGTTREAVVLDAHDRLDPNALGRVVGAVDGGGLLVLLTPPLDRWPDRTDDFDETLAVAPYDADDVTGHFRRRLVETLRAHPGVAVADVVRGTVERDGLTDPPPRLPPDPVEAPDDAAFPAAVYEACLTADQAETVAAFERLRRGHGRDGSGDRPSTDDDRDPRAVVVEADRGRGKSSAAGLAAAALAADGADVLVTAPAFRSAREVFARATELLAELRSREADPAGPDGDHHGADPAESSEVPRDLRTTAGGRIRFLPPTEAIGAVGEADVVFVDEAAALPVATLAATLDADRVAYTTTVHGYEGAGRGFSVRFRDRLADAPHEVTERRMDEPIRYAAGDPVETWAFRALMLDARPPVDPLVEDATPEGVEYRALDPDALVADEHLLREAFGLLVLAHYRTEPDDLARLLDAPNVSVRALLYGGHVVSVVLLAREGGLPAETRAKMYEGVRIRGHMLPDVLTSQLRDEDAGVPVGQRVMRIATHHAVRSRGLGSHLLARIREEFSPGDATTAGVGHDANAADEPGDVDGRERIDWLGTGFGATPDLLRFWAANGFRTVHCSVTRNERSGEHSAIMLAPLTDAGRALTDRHAAWFADRVGAMLTDPLRELDPDVVRETLGSIGVAMDLDLADREWRHVAAAAHGAGLYATNPAPFRRLVVAHLVDPAGPDALTPRQERLLVCAVCQGHAASSVTEALGFHTTSEALRAVGSALAALVEVYGTSAAREAVDRLS